jgi:hypothetical protein
MELNGWTSPQMLRRHGRQRPQRPRPPHLRPHHVRHLTTPAVTTPAPALSAASPAFQGTALSLALIGVTPAVPDSSSRSPGADSPRPASASSSSRTRSPTALGVRLHESTTQQAPGQRERLGVADGRRDPGRTPSLTSTGRVQGRSGVRAGWLKGGFRRSSARRRPSSIHCGIMLSSAPAAMHSWATAPALGSSSLPSLAPSKMPATSERITENQSLRKLRGGSVLQHWVVHDDVCSLMWPRA